MRYFLSHHIHSLKNPSTASSPTYHTHFHRDIRSPLPLPPVTVSPDQAKGNRKPGMFILRKFLLRSETFQSKSLPHTLSSSASYHTRLKSNQMKSPGRETLVRVNIKLCSLGMDTTDYYDLSAHPSTQLHFIVPTFHSQPLKGDFPSLIQLHCPVPVPCHNTERKLQVTEQRIPSKCSQLTDEYAAHK